MTLQPVLLLQSYVNMQYMHAYFSDITYIYKRIFEKEKFIMLNVENKL